MIEAIAERLDWKRDLYAKVAPHLAPHAVFASNTSGLSLAALSDALPERLRQRFCGVHFFNPPRYMHLVELIPAPQTDAGAARRARDVPHDDARQGRDPRQGHAELHRQPHRRLLDRWRRCEHTQTLGLGFDVVDALTGPAIGRAKSATYRTADVVGLDTMAHVIKTMRDTLPDDPWHRAVRARRRCSRRWWRKGALGQQDEGRASSARSARTSRSSIPPRATYRDGAPARSHPKCADSCKIRAPAEKFAQAARQSRIRRRSSCGRSSAISSTTARITWPRSPTTRATSISRSAGASAGRSGRSRRGRRRAGSEVARLDRRRHRRGQGARQGAAARVGERRARCGGARRAHAGRARIRRRRDAFVPRSHAAGLPRGSSFPIRCWASARDQRDDDLRDRRGAHVASRRRRRASCRSRRKANTIGEDGARRPPARGRRSRAAMRRARDLADEGAVLARRQPRGDRAGGAGRAVGRHRGDGRASSSRRRCACATASCRRLRGARHGARRLVRVHHALRRARSRRSSRTSGSSRPASACCRRAAGCKEFARARRRGSRSAAPAAARSTCSRSCARTSRRWRRRPSPRARWRRRSWATCGRPTSSSCIAHELLHVAKAQARALAEAGYRPPLPRRATSRSRGKTGIATLQMMLVNMRDGGFISAVRFRDRPRDRARAVRRRGRGGQPRRRGVAARARAQRSSWSCCADEQTQARIAHTLATGKPLRN